VQTATDQAHDPHLPPQAGPRTGRPGRGTRLALPLGLGAAALCGCVAVAAADPGDDGAPLCASRAVFGVDCPFCGGLRTTNALLRGNVGSALDHNVVLAVALPVAVLMWVWWVWSAWRDDASPAPAGSVPPVWLSVVAGVLVVAFGVVRNFSGAGWMRWLHSDAFAG
jgi:hypothetical protein